jgi:ubiquitin carboxyl-terminal hydrolase 8
MRSSNYNLVHDAVKVNFELALSDHGQDLPLGVCGLRNLGNTCFLNSSLQCLSNTIPLTDYFLGYDYRSEINKNNVLGTGGKLVVAYAELMKSIWLGKSTVVTPLAFKRSLEKFAPQFVGSRQHDAHEVLSFLLDGIHEDLNRIKKKPYIEDPDLDGSNDEQDAIDAWKNYLRRDKSLVVDIFQGQLKNTLSCLNCGHRNIRFEPFMYLSLPMNDTCRNLNDCLRLYLAEERLTGDNQWYCAKCKTHRDSTKKTDIWILPPILIVHLKRFKFNEYGHVGSKNNAPVDYPVQHWNLRNFIARRGGEEPLYDLYAVANQMGSLGGGHYTSYGLNRFDDRWYEFNDQVARPVATQTMKRNCSSAYLLFYNRSTDDTADGRAPLIRRQSANRPDLWPHAQVQNNDFRLFSRLSVRKGSFLSMPALNEPPANGQESMDYDSAAADDDAIEVQVAMTKQHPYITRQRKQAGRGERFL